MKVFIAALRSSFHFVALALITIVYALLCMLAAPLPLDLRYRFTCGWPKIILWLSRICLGIRWRVIGSEHLPDAPAIIAAKHQSAWETLFLTAYMPKYVCYVYKKELHYVPFFGWAMALMRMIAINRQKGSNAFEQVVQQGKKQLFSYGRWIVIFPEGTRTAVGKPSKYKSGAVRLAQETNVPIIPIAINSGRLWGKNAFIKYPGEITVSIGPALYPSERTQEQLQHQLKEWIETEMVRLNPEDYRSTTVMD